MSTKLKETSWRSSSFFKEERILSNISTSSLSEEGEVGLNSCRV